MRNPSWPTSKKTTKSLIQADASALVAIAGPCFVKLGKLLPVTVVPDHRLGPDSWTADGSDGWIMATQTTRNSFKSYMTFLYAFEDCVRHQTGFKAATLSERAQLRADLFSKYRVETANFWIKDRVFSAFGLDMACFFESPNFRINALRIKWVDLWLNQSLLAACLAVC
jgi:hypothetical protein